MSIANVSSLSKRIRIGAEGGLEFARICNLLIERKAGILNHDFQSVDDRSGDYKGLDAFSTSGFSVERKYIAGFQYKFYPSPLSNSHKNEILKSFQNAKTKNPKLRLWILIMPDDLNQHEFNWLCGFGRPKSIRIKHWGYTKLIELFLEFPALCSRYYPELMPSSEAKIDRLFRLSYDQLKNLLGPCYQQLRRLNDEWDVLFNEDCNYMHEEYLSDLPYRDEVESTLKIFEENYHLAFEKDLRAAFRNFRRWVWNNGLPGVRDKRFQKVHTSQLHDAAFYMFSRILYKYLITKQQLIEKVCLPTDFY